MNPISSTSSFKALPNAVKAQDSSNASANPNAKPLDSETYDFGKLLNESSMQNKIEKAEKERNAQGQDLLDQITVKKQQEELKGKHKKELDKDDFLKLFIAQIEAQDPTKPMDNIQLAEQMAQFNSLEQLMHVDKGIQDLAKNIQSSNMNTLVNYIGKQVEVEGGKLNLSDTGKVQGRFSLGQDAETTTVTVKDADGKEVNQIHLGKKIHGDQTFEWSGKMKDGSKALPGVYSYEVMASDIANRPIPSQIKTDAEVKGVKMEGNTPVLMTEIGNLKTNEVQAIRVKDSPTPLKIKPVAEQVDSSESKLSDQ